MWVCGRVCFGGVRGRCEGHEDHYGQGQEHGQRHGQGQGKVGARGQDIPMNTLHIGLERHIRLNMGTSSLCQNGTSQGS